MKKLLIALIIMSAASMAVAAGKPPEISSAIKAAQPYSQASLSKLWLKAYDAELWMDAPAWSINTPFAFIITYDMAFSSDELSERTQKEMQHVGVSKDTTMGYAEKLKGLFPNVKAGDRITALHLSDIKTQFYHNGNLLGTITDPQFARNFFDVWFSKRTSEPEMRKALLKV